MFYFKGVVQRRYTINIEANRNAQHLVEKPIKSSFWLYGASLIHINLVSFCGAYACTSARPVCLWDFSRKANSCRN